MERWGKNFLEGQREKKNPQKHVDDEWKKKPTTFDTNFWQVVSCLFFLTSASHIWPAAHIWPAGPAGRSSPPPPSLLPVLRASIHSSWWNKSRRRLFFPLFPPPTLSYLPNSLSCALSSQPATTVWCGKNRSHVGIPRRMREMAHPPPISLTTLFTLLTNFLKHAISWTIYSSLIWGWFRDFVNR